MSCMDIALEDEPDASSPSTAERARWAFEAMVSMREERLRAMGLRGPRQSETESEGVSYNDFMRWWSAVTDAGSRISDVVLEQSRLAFQKADADGNGAITLQDAEGLLEELHLLKYGHRKSGLAESQSRTQSTNTGSNDGNTLTFHMGFPLGLKNRSKKRGS